MYGVKRGAEELNKLEIKFAEREKKMNSLENKLQENICNQISKLGMPIENL